MLTKYEKAALQFSGGKDSTALLYKARPWLSQITVFFCDPGATLPHVEKYIYETCSKLGAKLEIVRPRFTVQEYIEKTGQPSEIVPVERTYQFREFMHAPKPMIQSMWQCCSFNYFLPLQAAIQEHGFKIVLRGSKKYDERVGVPNGYVENGVEYRSPLWNWTHQDVMDYLTREKVELPIHYKTVHDSMDCWVCTAYLGPQYHGKQRLEFIRDNYPELWPDLLRRIRHVRSALTDEFLDLRPALNMGDN